MILPSNLSYHTLRLNLAIVKRFNLPAVGCNWSDFSFLLPIGQSDLNTKISAVMPPSY